MSYLSQQRAFLRCLALKSAKSRKIAAETKKTASDNLIVRSIPALVLSGPWLGSGVQAGGQVRRGRVRRSGGRASWLDLPVQSGNVAGT